MRSFLAKANHCFAAGALGGCVQALAIWFVSQLGLFYVLGVPMLQELTVAWLTERVVVHGLWGFVFLLPLLAGRAPWLRGILLGLIPAAVALFFVNPFLDNVGILGLQMGWGWPLIVVFFNAVWGLSTAYWLRWTTAVGAAAQQG